MIVRRHCEVLSETSRYFTEHGVRPFFAYRSTNDDQVLSLVQAGLGITVMPASYSLKGVVRPLLAGFNLKASDWIFVRRQR
jgi:DNA-binding transcriptional LysR family regulator